MTNRFIDHWQPPMPGGWHFVINGEIIREHSAEACHETIKRRQVNNATFTTDDELWAVLWNYWCSLNPARCGMPVTGAAITPGEISKAQWGRDYWRYLAEIAVSFDREYFLQTISAWQRAVLPCPECRQHFSEEVAADPPWNINDAKAACQWVWRTHSAINKLLGKPIYTYEQGVAEFGFPVEP